jgi:hypothetical protein
MTIPTLIGLMVLYAVLSRAKFGTTRTPVYRQRLSRKEEIRARHARHRRYRAHQEKMDNKGTQEDVASSGCA